MFWRCFHCGLAAIVSILACASGMAREQDSEDHREVVMRMIGHQLLLHIGDTTSRVLPVERDENIYTLRFGAEISMNPDQLATVIDSVVISNDLATTYIVQVKSCNSKVVVYSYQVGGELQQDIVPCRSRDLPLGCYLITIHILDDGQSLAVASFAVPIILILLAISLIVLVRRNKGQNIESNSEQIKLGQYVFDERNLHLMLGNHRIELTGKEADLLMFLHSSANGTVEREKILEAVWGDEGDYVGRTLDVFISKLRKKLEADASLKIANIRGVGYRLIVNS